MVMRKLFYIISALVLVAVVIYMGSCVAKGGLVDPTDPITPAPEGNKDATVDPRTREITITKEGITVTAQHWSRYRVNQKYTTADMRSPFYYLETWEQAFQSEVFHVKIANGTPRLGVVADFKGTNMTDEREYVYRPMTINELEYKFVTKRMMDMKTKNSLQLAPQIMLNAMMADRRPLKAGQSIEGLLAFNVPSSQANKVWLTIVLEKEPETATAAYERLEFKYDFYQDLIMRAKQPVIKH